MVYVEEQEMITRIPGQVAGYRVGERGICMGKYSFTPYSSLLYSKSYVLRLTTLFSPRCC